MTSAGSGLGNWARLTLFSDTTTGTQLGIDLLNYFTDIRRLNRTINIDYEVSPSTFSRTTGLPTYFILHSTQSLFWLSEAFRAVRQSSQMMWPWAWWWRWWWYRQKEREELYLGTLSQPHWPADLLRADRTLHRGLTDRALASFPLPLLDVLHQQSLQLRQTVVVLLQKSPPL